MKNVIASMAIVYREPMQIKGPNNSVIPNPIVMDALRWFEKHFDTEEQGYDFCDKVKRCFDPTQTKPFPLLFDLEEVLDKYPVVSDVKQVTMNDALSAYANEHGIRYDSDPNDPTPLNEVFEMAESSVKGFEQVCKKHGMSKVYFAYREYYTAEWERYHPRSLPKLF